MRRIHEEDGRRSFREAIVLTGLELAIARNFVMERVTEATDAGQLIAGYWKHRKAFPVERLILDEDYGFSQRLAEAARYWQARLAAAQGIKSVVAEGYLDAVGDSRQTESINQGFTTVTPETGGGTSGGWPLPDFDIAHPQRVKSPTFAKKWTPEALRSDEEPLPATTAISESNPVGAIADPKMAEEALDALDEMERELRALLESGELNRESVGLLDPRAFDLIAELRQLLRKVATNEVGRLRLVRDAAASGGKLVATIADTITVGELAARLGTNAPAVLEHVWKLASGIVPHIG